MKSKIFENQMIHKFSGAGKARLKHDSYNLLWPPMFQGGESLGTVNSGKKNISTK